MDNDRAAAKRRASFGRADRLQKEARQKTEQAKVAQRRKDERAKADQQRKEEAVKAAEQRQALARKRAEQRRLDRLRANLRQEFSRTAARQTAMGARAEAHRKADAAKRASQQQASKRDPQRRIAEAHVRQQEQRQLTDQAREHRRQTERLRAEHQVQRTDANKQQLAALIQHGQQIRNIDFAERRDLDALDTQQRGLRGRVVGLVRPGHFARQERAIVERHENERWQKHRDHEATKDRMFWAEQAKRLARTADRMMMAKIHQADRQELIQAQNRIRPRAIDARVQTMVRSTERQQAPQQDNVRPIAPFGRAAGQSLEMKR